MTHRPMRYVRSLLALLTLGLAGYLLVALIVYALASLGRWLT